jgi:ABC-type transport system involved in multi-copper enzyme maturation permease subunit
MTVLLIAHGTFREAVRDRLLVGTLAGGAVLLALTQLVSPLALGEGTRLTVDLGLSAITLLGLLVILMVGTGLVSKEIDKRTIYQLLSRPIPRPAYLVGKWMGLSATLWLLAAGIAAALTALLAVRGYPQHAVPVMQAAYLAGLELSLVTAFAVLFSALSTPMLSALYTLGMFMAGQWTYDLRAFAKQFPPALAGTCNVLADVIPNLPVFNIRTLAAGAETAPAGHLVLASVYAAVTSACALSLAAAAFERRDFK